ncbi:MAG TPA: DHH family phosphoesterase [Acidimicrobiia bacterium]|nr:DHH family phosphoesterase [Acidimicrobiia bacterium]
MAERFPDLTEAGRVLAGAEEIALTCHVGPDGDAMGSMLAVASAAATAGKRALPSFGPPFVVIPAFRFLPIELLVEPSQVPRAPAVMVTFDSGSLERLGELAGPASRAETLIVVDHHAAGSGGFGHLNLIDPRAAASAELAVLLIEAAGWKIDEKVATCLLTGLVTDTGRFQYSNTTPATLRLAADLVAAGARPEIIGQHIYEETPFGFLMAAGRVLERAHLDIERSLVWTVMYLEDLTKAGIGLADTDPLIDLVRLPLETDVALLLKEHGPDIFKGSLRSRGATDVGAVAQALGGGGHHNAAGFTFEGTAEAAVAAVQRLLTS